MTIAIRKPVDARALVEASQAIRQMIGTLQPVSWARVPRRSAISPPTVMTPGCMTGRKWSKRDISKLEALAGKTPPEEIASLLGRTRSSVCGKANQLNLSTRVRRRRRPYIAVDHVRSQAIFAGCYPSMRAIIRSVSEETGVSIDAILCRSKTRTIVLARRVMLWTLARDTKLSMKQLGARLRLDHSTIIHAIRKEDAARGTDVRSRRSLKNEGRPA